MKANKRMKSLNDRYVIRGEVTAYKCFDSRTQKEIIANFQEVKSLRDLQLINTKFREMREEGEMEADRVVFLTKNRTLIKMMSEAGTPMIADNKDFHSIELIFSDSMPKHLIHHCQ